MPASSSGRTVVITPTLSPVRPRLLATWTLAHGVRRLALAAAAQRAIRSPARRSIRASGTIRSRRTTASGPTGPLVHGKLMSATATHSVANEVLRSDAFRSGAAVRSAGHQPRRPADRVGPGHGEHP